MISERWKHRARHIRVQAQDDKTGTGWHWAPHSSKNSPDPVPWELEKTSFRHRKDSKEIFSNIYRE